MNLIKKIALFAVTCASMATYTHQDVFNSFRKELKNLISQETAKPEEQQEPWDFLARKVLPHYSPDNIRLILENYSQFTHKLVSQLGREIIRDLKTELVTRHPQIIDNYVEYGAMYIAYCNMYLPWHQFSAKVLKEYKAELEKNLDTEKNDDADIEARIDKNIQRYLNQDPKIKKLAHFFLAKQSLKELMPCLNEAASFDLSMREYNYYLHTSSAIDSAEYLIQKIEEKLVSSEDIREFLLQDFMYDEQLDDEDDDDND